MSHPWHEGVAVRLSDEVRLYAYPLLLSYKVSVQSTVAHTRATTSDETEHTYTTYDTLLSRGGYPEPQVHRGYLPNAPS